jgi:hypothetical protein
MSLDRPETSSTSQTKAGGNGHDHNGGSTTTEVDDAIESDQEKLDSVDPTEKLISPGVGDTTPVEVPRVPEVPPVAVATEEQVPDQQARRRQRGPGDSEGRWVTHRLRHLSVWSVLKVAGLFYLCLFFSILVATVLLWNVGRVTGTIDRFESFVSGMGSYGECVPEKGLKPGTEFERDEDCKEGNVRIGMYEIDGRVVFRSALMGGIVFVVAGTVATVLMAILFNLLNDVTGGVRYTLVREPGPGAGPPAGRRPGRLSRLRF